MSNPLEIVFLFFSGLYYIGGFLLSLWWIYLPVFLFVLLKDIWLKYKRQDFIQKMEWVLLEIKPPREIKKTPQAMEQFFTALHGVQSKPNWKERNIQGQTQRWFSLETVSFSGEIHFFIRTISRFRNLVEANIYAQYPETEITQVDDYVYSISPEMFEQNYSLIGSEMVLNKEDAYPIRTYPEFEKNIFLEEQRIDPVASLLEMIGKLREGEQIWIQTLVRPVADDWKKAGEALRDKLVGRQKKIEQGELKKEAIAWKEAGKAVAHQLITGEPLDMPIEEKKPETYFLWKTTKAEQEVIYAVEQNVAKLGFETIIRFFYFAPKEIFNKPTAFGIMGAYKQFNTQNLNGFKLNKKMNTEIDYKIHLKTLREPFRRKRLVRAYQKRDFTQHSEVITYLKPMFFERLPILNLVFIRSKPFVFNTEELATVYHYPLSTVKAPLVPKVEARKAEPPSGLPLR